MAPPSVNKKSKQKWEHDSSVEVWSVDIENTVPFEAAGWIFP